VTTETLSPEVAREIRALAKPWLDAEQAAEYLNTSERNFRENVAVQPGFPRPRKRGGLRLMWSRREIDEWMESA
jgi:predicted DNA-binding transcriptional regulator AlpA